MKVYRYIPEVNERIKKSVLEDGREITELASIMGIARSNLYGAMYYNQNPSTHTIMAICQVLGKSADYILFGKE